MSGDASDNNKFASLSSGLLARKGDARPAMRRPTADLGASQENGGDDLGWNDFGDDKANDVHRLAVSRHPEVKRQQLAIVEQLGVEQLDAEQPVAQTESPLHSDPEPDPPQQIDAEAAIRPVIREMKIKARRRGRAPAAGSAAFTLRLDEDRHLRLRLACAVHNISAQKLLTEALDALLDSMPEIEPLAVRVASR